MVKHITATRVVLSSLAVSISDVVLNLFVAVITGSTVMLSQALQGFSDLTTSGILFVGIKRSKRKADDRHPFGYGREIFFWVLIAGIFMFLGTGLASLYLGWQQFFRPETIDSIWLAFAMLTFGFCSNGWAFSLSLRRLQRSSRRAGWWKQLLTSSFVETKATLLVDFLGTLAALLGLLALGTYVVTDDPRYDGLGSIMIGLSMMVASVFLIRDIRELIVGRAVDSHTSNKITKAILSVDNVQGLLDLRTMYLGSNKLLVIAEVHLFDGLETNEIELITDHVKAAVIKEVPSVHHIQVEVETP